MSTHSAADRLRRIFCLALVVIATTAIPQVAYSGLLNLPQTLPDMSAGPLFGTYTYEAGVRHFVGEGEPLTVYDGTNFYNVDPLGSFKIDVTADAAGNPTGGTLLVTGAIPSLSINSTTTLFSGVLSAFGFSEIASEPFFDFIFELDASSALQSMFGSHLYVEIDLQVTGPGNNTYSAATPFEFDMAVADAQPVVPESSMLVTWSGLIALAAGVLFGRRRLGRVAVT